MNTYDGDSFDRELLPNRGHPFDSHRLPAIFDGRSLGGNHVVDILELGVARFALRGGNLNRFVVALLIPGECDIRKEHRRHDEKEVGNPPPE